VDILWIMPVHPIGKKNRKGSLGSYYASRDFKAVNPEFGTLEDLRRLIQDAHQLGMHVLLDWVANHTAWDHVWTETNPEFYRRDDEANFISPWDWTDVIALDYQNSELRAAMIDAMAYWLKETNIDGFRCDMAGLVPVDFWEQARDALEQVKPLFMLAEDEENLALLHKAFDMNFTWEMHHLMNGVARGQAKATDIWNKYRDYSERFPESAYRMYFTSNHDEDSHSGTALERMGEAYQCFAVLTYLLPGMPLTYSGQETGTEKRLSFFDKDALDWSRIPLQDFYRRLNRLKKEHEALWCGSFGGDFVNLNNKDLNENILAIKREKEEDLVIAVLNLSATSQQFVMPHDMLAGKYTEVFTGEHIYPGKGYTFELKPWEFQILVK
jgi:glycosidase